MTGINSRLVFVRTWLYGNETANRPLKRMRPQAFPRDIDAPCFIEDNCSQNWFALAACIVASVKAPAVSDVAASEALQLETSIQRLCDGMPATLTQIRVFQRFVAIFEAT